MDDLNDDRKVKDSKPYTVNSENGCVTLSESHFAELQGRIQSLSAELVQREATCLLAKQVNFFDYWN